MRRAASTTLVGGRHRWGRPGLVHVSYYVAVVRRGLFASWRHAGKHRHQGPARPVPYHVPEPIPAI